MSQFPVEPLSADRRRWPRRSLAVIFILSLFAVLCGPSYLAKPTPDSASQQDTASEFSLTIADNDVSVPFDPVVLYATKALEGMSLEQKIRSLLVVHAPGTNVATLQAFMVVHGAGGFILMGNNVPSSPEELASLTAALSLDPQLPALVSIDEEGGYVTRLPYDGFAGANTLRDQDPAATLAAFSGRAALLKSVGVNVNFGIDADVTADPQSFIFARTFGNTPEEAAVRVTAAVDGEKSLVASTVKHFPGHGSAAGDSHVSIPSTGMSLEQWRATDAVPFMAGIDAGADLVMFGHLAFTAVDAAPASLSVAWHQILRDDLGFTGIAITDDMSMLQGSGLPEYSDPVENAIAALAAGNDALLYVLAADPSLDGIDPQAIVAGLVAAVESGRIQESQVDASALRMLSLRRSFAPEALTWFPPCPAPCLAFLETPTGK
jgi:beta-N-acetylhexosaminidase